jgi:hypothetical protein
VICARPRLSLCTCFVVGVYYGGQKLDEGVQWAPSELILCRGVGETPNHKSKFAQKKLSGLRANWNGSVVTNTRFSKIDPMDTIAALFTIFSIVSSQVGVKMIRRHSM